MTGIGLKKRNINKDVLQVIILSSLLVVIILVAGILKPGFLTAKHLITIVHDTSILGISAIGQTIVILTGGIDLSVGATMLMADAVGAMLLGGENRIIPILICLGLGLLIGAINGTGVAFLRIPPFIMTLGMMAILTGSIFIFAKTCGFASPILRYLSIGKVGNIPILIIIWIFLAMIMTIIMRLTVFGREVYAIGSNPIASYHSGIKNRIVIFFVYVISGIFSAIAGLFLLGYTGVPELTYRGGGLGTNYTLSAIAAVIIGGTIFTGARGGVEKTIFGVLVLKILFSILTMMGMSGAGKLITQGLVVIVIVGIYMKLENLQEFSFKIRKWRLIRGKNS
jgi:ribose transport system permease protein